MIQLTGYDWPAFVLLASMFLWLAYMFTLAVRFICSAAAWARLQPAPWWEPRTWEFCMLLPWFWLIFAYACWLTATR